MAVILNRFLFDLDSEFDELDIEYAVMQAIANYEPRAIVRKVNVKLNGDNNSILIEIIFQVVNVSETQQVKLELTRLR